LGIVEGHGRFAIRAFAMVGDAIFQEHGGDALGVEPIANVGAFEIDGKELIAACRDSMKMSPCELDRNVPIPGRRGAAPDDGRTFNNESEGTDPFGCDEAN